MIFSVIGPIFLTKPRIECIWHHEGNKNFRCLSMDAVSSASSSFIGSSNDAKYQNVLHYIHVALFCFTYHHGGNSSSNVASTSQATQRKVYSIDIGGDELERKQLEVNVCLHVIVSVFWTVRIYIYIYIDNSIWI